MHIGPKGEGVVRYTLVYVYNQAWPELLWQMQSDRLHVSYHFNLSSKGLFIFTSAYPVGVFQLGYQTFGNLTHFENSLEHQIFALEEKSTPIGY